MFSSVLKVDRLENYRFRFSLQNLQNLHFPTTSNYVVEVNPHRLGEINEEITSIINESNNPQSPNTNIDYLKESGKKLFDLFFPKRAEILVLAQDLKQLNTPLKIWTNEPNVIWELMYDGNDFLFLKNKVGRILDISGKHHSIPKSDDQWKCLIIANPTKNLKDSEEEAIELKKVMEGKGICHYLVGEDTKLGNVEDHIKNNTYDIIHYSGHIVKNSADGQYAFSLFDEKLLWATDIHGLLNGTPIVFLNGCWGAANVRQYDVQDYADRRKGIESMTEAFLLADAQLVVGALFAIPNRGAKVFSKVFYQHMLNGKTAGEAIQAARLKTQEELSYGATWSSYVMYGDPMLKIEPNQKDLLLNLLQLIGLTRESFTNSSQQLLEKALETGKSIGGCSSIALFMALVSQPDSPLSIILGEQRVNVEGLQESFQQIIAEIEKSNNDNKQTKDVLFSNTVTNVLITAKRKVEEDNKDKIEVADLARAFINTGGGSVGRLINNFQKSPALVWPRPSLPSIPDTPEKLRSVTREILRCTLEAALKSKLGVISSVHLLHGILSAPSFLFYDLLRQQGVNPFELSNQLNKLLLESNLKSTNGISAESYQYSRSVRTILQTAKKISEKKNQDRIAEEHLVIAFLEFNKGMAYKLLGSMEFFPELIFHSVFKRDGSIEKEKFEKDAYDSLVFANDFANEIGNRFVSRIHLFYGLYKLKESFVKSIIDQYEIDHEVIFTEIIKIARPLVAYPGPIILGAPNLMSSAKKTIILSYLITQQEEKTKITAEEILKGIFATGKSSVEHLIARLGIDKYKFIKPKD